MYAIHYTGLFSSGYVRHTLFEKEGMVQHQTADEAVDFATKYRFKFIAALLCMMHNYNSQKNYDFKTFKVVEINKKDKKILILAHPYSN